MIIFFNAICLLALFALVIYWARTRRLRLACGAWAFSVVVSAAMIAVAFLPRDHWLVSPPLDGPEMQGAGWAAPPVFMSPLLLISGITILFCAYRKRVHERGSE